MKITLRVWLLLVGLAAASCKSQTTYHLGAHSASPGQVEHVVLVWLKDPADAGARARIIEATKTFKQIPGVIDARAGRAIPSTQPTVDATFDVGIVVTFKDRESLKAYGPHPIHAKAARELIVPVMKSVKAYDMELE
jgi:stress responsive alpha/beta barrel protein